MNLSISAIVLTCQRYAPLAEHMIHCYQKVWPDSPFIFLLPDGQATREVAARLGSKVVLRETREGNARGRFRAAVLDMLQGFDNDEWVYWCPDDKYPIWVNRSIAQAVITALSDTPSDIAGLSLTKRPSSSWKTRGRNASEGYWIHTIGFSEIFDYKRIWLHQFLRVRVLRHLFERFPAVIESAKVMDTLHRQIDLPSGSRRFVVNRNAMVLGESTHRGMITANCAESLLLDQGLPDGFQVSGERIVIGKRPWHWRFTG